MVWFNHQHKEDDERWRTNKGPMKQALCPVCKQVIGLRFASEIKSFECEECNTTFTFYPNCNKPSSKVHSLEPRICNCPTCQFHRKKKSE